MTCQAEMSEIAWRTVSLPSALLEGVKSFLEENPDYASVSEFIREAIRERLRDLAQESPKAEILR